MGVCTPGLCGRQAAWRTMRGLQVAVPWLKGTVLCSRPLVVVNMPCCSVFPKRNKVSPAVDGENTGNKRRDSTSYSHSQDTLDIGRITKHSFGSFELLTSLDVSSDAKNYSESDATKGNSLEKSKVIKEIDVVIGAAVTDSTVVTKSDVKEKPKVSRESDVMRQREVIAESEVSSVKKRPLVILIPWLNARQSTVYKYSSLYLGHGIDVLTMKVTPMQIIRPLQTKKVVGELLELLQDKNSPMAERPLLIHGFSIGAFVWGQLLVEMDRLKRSVSDLDHRLSRHRVPMSDITGSEPDLRSKGAVSPAPNTIELAGADWTTVDLDEPPMEGIVGTGANDPTQPTKTESQAVKAPNTKPQAEKVDAKSSSNGIFTKGQTKDDPITKSQVDKVDPKSIGDVADTKSQAKKVPNSKDNEEKDKVYRTSSRDETDDGISLRSTDIQSRFVGVVMDSPTPYENILEGIPNSISDNNVVKAAIRNIFATYMRTFPSSVTTHYIQGAEAAENNVAGLPTLMLYSSADRIVSSTKLDEVVAGWQKKGVFVRSRKWADTPHVGHFRLYPQEYGKELQAFLEHLQLTKSKL